MRGRGGGGGGREEINGATGVYFTRTVLLSFLLYLLYWDDQVVA